MAGETTPANPLALADEDFLKQNGPPPAPADGEGGESGQGDGSDNDDDAANGNDQGGDDNNEGDGDGQGDGAPDGADDKGGSNPEDKKGDKAEEGDDPPSGKEGGDGGNLSQDKSQGKAPPGKKPADDKAPKPKDGEGKPVEDDGKQGGDAPPGSKADDTKETPPDYKALYESLMAPLKANGKIIDIKSPEELKQLAQMGANYTRKMQALAPHRKLLLMLENNGLLDEGKLSFLIDIEKKNPEAIKKLIKEAGLDPREIDLEDPNAKPYLVGNHRVTDEEAGFRTVLDELGSNPEGKATLQAITLWDQASKDVLWKEPEVMQLIHQQRETGVYDRISTELERQRALGKIPPTVPFLHAYKAIGDQMASAGQFDDLFKPAPQQQQQPPAQAAPVATTVAKPKPAVKNGDKANAASSTRSTSQSGAKTAINPLALSDADFMKEVEAFQGRL